MSDLLYAPLKKTSEINTAPLRNLIHSAYNSSTIQKTLNYSEAVGEFGSLRNLAVSKFVERNEASLEALYR